VLNPSPLGGGNSASILSSKAIGYYESWANSLSCHKISPMDLPLYALTQLVASTSWRHRLLTKDSINFAFAYIDPNSYDIVTMDASTPSSLFIDTADVRSVKQDLSIFISVGGW
jgi:chitinase